MKTYTVRAKRWAHGWELDVAGVGVTQSRSLAAAERQARDYISLVRDFADDSFDIRLDVTVDSSVDQVVEEAKRLRAEADRIGSEASEAVRAAVAALTRSGISTVRDVGVVLGLSPQRVQQLKEPSKAKAAPARPRKTTAALSTTARKSTARKSARKTTTRKSASTGKFTASEKEKSEQR